VSVHQVAQSVANHINNALHHGVNANAGVGPIPQWLPDEEVKFSSISSLHADLGEYVNLSAGRAYKLVSDYEFHRSPSDKKQIKMTEYVMLHGRSLYRVTIYLYDEQIGVDRDFPSDVITHWSWQTQPVRR
jgi:hypothetical protein